MRFKFRMPLFNTPLWLYVGKHGREAFGLDCKKYFGLDDEISSSEGRCCGSLVWIKAPRLDIFAHEMVHFIHCTTDHLGISDENKEVEAYLMSWLMLKVWPKINTGGTK